MVEKATWYGWVLHECVAVFSRATGEWQYSTRVQYPAILPSQPSNNRFIIYHSDFSSI